MSDPTVELANKIDLHLKIDVPGAGYFLTEEDQRMIVDCLRASTPKSEEIERLQKLVDAQEGPVPHPHLFACTVSCTGQDITIQCSDHDVKDVLMDWLTGMPARRDNSTLNTTPRNQDDAASTGKGK